MKNIWSKIPRWTFFSKVHPNGCLRYSISTRQPTGTHRNWNLKQEETETETTSPIILSLFSLLLFCLNGCSHRCCEEKKEGELAKDEAAILELPGLDQHQGGRCDQVERHLGEEDEEEDNEDGDDRI